MWPEQEAVDTWAKGYGINASAEELYELKEAVSKPRLEVQDRLRQAEAEVERLIKINQECEQEAHIQDEILRRYKAENAKLRKVAEAARRVMDAVMAQPQDVKERNIALAWLDAALVELDKEGTVER